uniref:Uncharacterized protein n=2 Tax=Octactis speculum TaxID=3111310 RepID=A0A7S2GJL7_9STRA
MVSGSETTPTATTTTTSRAATAACWRPVPMVPATMIAQAAHPRNGPVYAVQNVGSDHLPIAAIELPTTKRPPSPATIATTTPSSETRLHMRSWSTVALLASCGVPLLAMVFSVLWRR